MVGLLRGAEDAAGAHGAGDAPGEVLPESVAGEVGADEDVPAPGEAESFPAEVHGAEGGAGGGHGDGMWCGFEEVGVWFDGVGFRGNAII